jgi:hypothetical protein
VWPVVVYKNWDRKEGCGNPDHPPDISPKQIEHGPRELAHPRLNTVHRNYKIAAVL